VRRFAGPGAPLGFDAGATATGLGIITGGLSLAVPSLVVLTGTLASIAVAAWLLGQRRNPGPRVPGARRRTVIALGALVAGGFLFLDPPPAIGPFRALLLAILLLPLWHESRVRRSPGLEDAERP